MAEEFRSSEEICEALVRHVEVSGSDVLEKHYVDGTGKVLATCWCVVGEDSAGFAEMAREWLIANGYVGDD